MPNSAAGPNGRITEIEAFAIEAFAMGERWNARRRSFPGERPLARGVVDRVSYPAYQYATPVKRFLAPAFVLAVLLVAGCASGDAESKDASAATADTTALPKVTVYKSATCNCCSRWVDHMKQAGFSVETVNRSDLGAVKRRLGVPQRLRSCHTARVGDEVVEGHVLARVVKGYLKGQEKGRAQGLAVPGMPIGSPGMEMPNRAAQPYRVVAFKKDGRTGVYSRHNQQ